jgi:hypothetical protein
MLISVRSWAPRFFGPSAILLLGFVGGKRAARLGVRRRAVGWASESRSTIRELGQFKIGRPTYRGRSARQADGATCGHGTLPQAFTMGVVGFTAFPTFTARNLRPSSRVNDCLLAEAVWRAVIQRWPRATIILRQGARVVVLTDNTPVGYCCRKPVRHR